MAYSFESVVPVSPDGASIYGDTLEEQWLSVWFEAADYNALRRHISPMEREHFEGPRGWFRFREDDKC